LLDAFVEIAVDLNRTSITRSTIKVKINILTSQRELVTHANDQG
jgi:hypothetical protein